MDAVQAAFAAQPRTGFLPAALRERAAYDGPLEIGGGQTCSQPRTVEAMLRLLDVHRGMRVLDVGAGSGWTTALLAHLVGPDGEVLGVEIDARLAASGARHVGATAQPWARVRPAEPGVLGAPDEGPWERILVSAMARRLPEVLVGQLADGGLMVVPVAGEMLRVQRRGAARTVTRHGSYRFVPLRTDA